MNRSEQQALETVESALAGRITLIEAALYLLPILRMSSELAEMNINLAPAWRQVVYK